mmetsp:Transcript_23799/g.59346  ORF Transcript_23799/g.59346 Transcript_23799/m.59346 type:complete len:140 (+) Transcript_23799:103-522(+)
MGTPGIGKKWVAFVMRLGSDTLLELQASDRELMTLMAQQLARRYSLDQGFANLEHTISSVVLMKQQLAAAGKSANALLRRRRERRRLQRQLRCHRCQGQGCRARAAAQGQDGVPQVQQRCGLHFGHLPVRAFLHPLHRP